MQNNTCQKKTRKQKGLAVFCLALALFVLFAPVLTGKKILFPSDLLHTMISPYAEGRSVHVYNHFLNDIVVQYFPYKKLTQTALLQGRWAYWNPLILGGYPQYALTMAGNFDVTNLLLVFIPDPLQAYFVQILALLFIAGISMFALLQYYQLPVNASLLGAVCYMLNSMFICTIFFPWIMGAFCWMPAAVLFLDKSLRDRLLRDQALCALLTGCAMMAASVQTMSFIFFLTFVFSVMYGYVFARTFRDVATLAKIYLTIHVWAIGLTAVMLLPTLELFYFDAIQGGQWGNVGQGAIPFVKRLWGVAGVISFAFPQLAGSVRAFDLTKLASSTMMFYNGFIGFLPLLFGLLSVRNIKKDKRIIIYMTITLFGLLVPLASPFLKYVYHRFFIIYIFGMSVLSAFGLTYYLQWQDKDKMASFLRKVTALFVLVVLVLLAGHVFIQLFYDDVLKHGRKFVEAHLHMANLLAGNRGWYLGRVEKLLQHFNFFAPAIFIPVATMALGLGALWAHRANRLKSSFTGLILFITVFQLLFFAWSWLPMVSPQEYPLYPETQSVNFLKKDQDLYRVLIYNNNTNRKPVYSPNILSVYGIETINGYESVEPKTIRYLIQGMDPAVLGLCNVKYIITHDDPPLRSPHLHLTWEGEGLHIYENELFVPRAFFRCQHEVRSETDILQGIRTGRLDTSRKVFFSEGLGGQAGGQQGENLRKPLIKLRQYSPEEVLYEVETQVPGYFVLSQSWYPGWTCYLDGRQEEVRKANYCMLAVRVPAGKHKVRFVFRPRIFYIGLAVSSIFFLLILISLRKKRHAS